MEKQKRALEECPEDEDIAYYAKKLRLKSKKNMKGIPKEFYSDGLGEILEFIEGRDENDYEKWKLDDEAPEEVSQREFQLFPTKNKSRTLTIPKGKAKSQTEEEEDDYDEEAMSDEEDDDDLNEEESDFSENSEENEEFDEEDEEEDGDDDEEEEEEDAAQQPQSSRSLLPTNSSVDSSNKTQKWVSKRVQMKMGNLSISEDDSKSKDLSYLDEESDEGEATVAPKTVSLKEDMYGRLIDQDGNVVKQSNNSEQKAITFEDVGAFQNLNTKIRGLLNRLTVKTIPFVAEQIEELYKNHSNNLMAKCLFECIKGLVVENTLIASQKLCTELVMLISVLHSHIGEEVSGNLLHNLILVFDESFLHLQETGNHEGKKLENLLLLFCLFYSANIVSDDLIYDILTKFVDLFCPKSIELMLFVLKLVGYLLRKDNVSSMKEFIVKSQQKAANFDKQALAEKKIVFLLDALTHIKNNNHLKMDLSDIQGVLPVDKQAFRNDMKSLFKDLNVAPLPGKYKEILRTNRWFVQSGELLEQSIKRKNELRQERAIPTFNDKLCKKMHLTTPFRKLIFNTLISCDDYVECCQNLIQAGKKKHFEVISVCAHVALSEKQFNAFYVHLFRYLSHVDRNYKRGIMFVVRDKINAYEQLTDRQKANLSKLCAELLRLQVLSLPLLKCIDFKDMTDLYKNFLSETITKLFDSSDNRTLSGMFKKLPKKDSFTISLKLFINMFLGSNYKNRLKQIKEHHEGLDKMF